MGEGKREERTRVEQMGNTFKIHLKAQITDSKIYVLWLASRKKKERTCIHDRYALAF